MTSLDNLVVAIDGTSGSGKSSTSRGVAQALGLRYLDTGAMYRAMTWGVLQKGVDLEDPEAVAQLSDLIEVRVGTDPGDPEVSVGEQDVSVEIRGPEVTAAVSLVSAVPEVRSRLVAQQRELIGVGGIVVEGRDIATTVAPHAQVKVYLTADPTARAHRRAAELGASVEAAHNSLVSRDKIDSSRAASPLLQADEAVHIDTTELGLAEVIQQIVELAVEASNG